MEAEGVATDLGLLQELSGAGDPVRVGSAALGLMVRRDLDITVVCPELQVMDVAQIGATLAGHPGVRQVLFRNDTGQWKSIPVTRMGCTWACTTAAGLGRTGRSMCGSSASLTVNRIWLTCGHFRRV